MKRVLLAMTLGLIVWACSEEDEPTTSTDNFDRAAMLINWADNIIIPGYEAYVEQLTNLSAAKDAFLEARTEDNLVTLRSSWLDAYISWQKVSMFEIGKAETLTLRDYTNIFPTDATQIEENVATEDYNLELPSTRSQQGFPAIDYLINGSADSDAAIVTRFEENKAMQDYLSNLVDRLSQLSSAVLDDWKNGYRDTFVEKDGSSASSSVNKMTNDYIFYYEKALRAGKIGIPAGVFSNTPLSDRVEALYKKDVSKVLYDNALQATIDFFNGKHFDGNGEGESLKSYLDFLNTISEGENLSAIINNQFNAAQEAGDQFLGDNFFEEVENSNTDMLKTYDELQSNVILMKVDMLQALNIKVDYVDADGD